MKESIPIFVEVRYVAGDGFTSSAWRRPPPDDGGDRIPSDFLDGKWTLSRRAPPTAKTVSAALKSIATQILRRV